MQTIQPSADHPLPFDLTDEQPKTHSDAVATAVNTVDLISELGGSIDYGNEDLAKAQNLITGTQKPNTPKHVSSSAEAAAAHRLIKEVDFQAFSDAPQARHFINSNRFAGFEILSHHSSVFVFFVLDGNSDSK